MIICGTGHRPNKLGGYHIYERLVDLAKAALVHYQTEHVISGMALGWDQALAQAATELGIPWTAAIPFAGQESRWPVESQQYYHSLLEQAASTITLDQGPFTAQLMQDRNEWMVNEATHVLALWNGTHGGTYNCIRYAQAQKMPIINLWQSWVKHK
jgi:uncharacterized phage-like protein YoqJ